MVGMKKYFIVTFIAITLYLNASPDDLPVIRIYTENELPITSKEDYTHITMFSLTDPDHPENNVFRNNPKDEMRGRGNATWNYPKKPYRIRFKENTSLFGHAAYRNWILLAEYRDPTFLTTPIAFELGRNVLDYQPYTNTYQHVHLYLNGRYDGVYGLTEHRQASPDGVGVPGRVGIDPREGWFVEMSIYAESPYFRTRNYDLLIVIHTNNAPTGDPNDSNNPFYDFIKKDCNNLCDLMASPGFPENGYRDLVDLNTVVDFVMAHEIVGNTDGISLTNSIFIYKDKGGKISFGPLWDFDISFGWDWGIHNHIYFVQGTSKQLISKHAFFQRFYEDPVFLVKYKEHWNKKYTELSTFPNFIDALGKKIRPALLQDSERWAIPSGGYVYSTYDTNHARQVGFMIDWWNSRIPWLNTELNKVELLPANKNFGTVVYNNNSGLPNHTFTLVAIGKMENLTARFEKGNANFEISSEFMQTATGEGGYLATISVKPKGGLLPATYSDALIVSGTNQGKSFSLKASMSLVVSKAAGAEVPTPTLESKSLTSITVRPIAPLSNGQTVEFAISQTNLAPNDGWKRYSTTFNLLKPNTLYYVFARSVETNYISAGPASAPLQVVTNNEMNHIDEIQEHNPLQAFMRYGLLHISGLTPGKILYIYNAASVLVYQSIATGKEMDISLKGQGLYIVRSEEQTVKVILKE